MLIAPIEQFRAMPISCHDAPPRRDLAHLAGQIYPAPQIMVRNF
jgi:hypothetical protein